MDRAEKRNEERFEEVKKRFELADNRMDKFEQKLEATRKLVEAGIKLVTKLSVETRELKRSQKAFLDSFRNASNGHKRN